MRSLLLIAMLAVALSLNNTITSGSDVTCSNNSVLYNIAIFLLHIPLTKDMSFQDRMLFDLKRKKTGKSCTELIQFSKVIN